ncbi:MAG: hypothetical protein ABJQ29_05075 [Luteolibacter sp.]
MENSSAVQNGVSDILDNSKFVYDSEHSDLYALYYEVQAMMIRGGSDWANYNDAIKGEVIKHQSPDGSWPMPATVLTTRPTGIASISSFSRPITASCRELPPNEQLSRCLPAGTPIHPCTAHVRF